MSCEEPRQCLRARMLHDEQLIDLDEWAGLHGYPNPFPIPSGITAALWRRINKLPFKLAGKVTADQRICLVVKRAQQCLVQRFPNYAELVRPEGVRLAFAVPLQSRSAGQAHTPLSIYCGPCGCQPLVLTIGLPSEVGGARSDSPMSLQISHAALDSNTPRARVQRVRRTYLRLYTEL